MENEKIMAVLTELMEDQRQIARNQAEIIMIIQQLKIKQEQIENNLKSTRSQPESVNMKPMQQALENGIAEIKLRIDMLRQKSTSNNLRVFLESDAKKWAVILLVAVIFLTYLYLFGVHRLGT